MPLAPFSGASNGIINPAVRESERGIIMGTKGEGNRQRIVRAADRLFYRRGYNQTSFQDISDETGIPRGNFYYYFKTKDDILDAVVNSRNEAFMAILSQCENSIDSPVGRLLKFAEMLDDNQDDVIESGCPIGTLSSELAKDGAQLQGKSQTVFRQMHEWVARQFEALGAENPDDLAMDLLARMQGVTVIACAFKDSAFLQRSLRDIKQWINSKTV